MTGIGDSCFFCVNGEVKEGVLVNREFVPAPGFSDIRLTVFSKEDSCTYNVDRVYNSRADIPDFIAFRPSPQVLTATLEDVKVILTSQRVIFSSIVVDGNSGVRTTNGVTFLKAVDTNTGKVCVRVLP